MKLYFLPLLIFTLTQKTQSEFTIITPDSNSPLLTSPQTSFSTHATTDPDEQSAVYQIMASTGNPWASSISNICANRWHGIECTPDTNNVYHVVSLSFGALSDDTAFPTCDPASATLNPSVLKLTHLRTLFFYRCFTLNPQPIPSFLGLLGPSLHSLVLRDNGHVGPIPPNLANLTSLTLLDLHGNDLQSSIPPALSTLVRIRKLDLSSNQLTGTIPKFTFPGLNVLDLSRNLFQGSIPEFVTNHDSLIKMDLSRNWLTGPIPDSITRMRNLMLLDLSHNRLTGLLPKGFDGLISLRTLILKGNLIPDIRGLSGLKELGTLVLSDMGLRGAIPDSLGEMSRLRVLYLDNNELNGSIPGSLRKLERLSELRLNNNRLRGLIPFSKEMIWRMGRKMRIQNNAGLCYDVEDGGMEEMDSMSGISYCDPNAVDGSGDGPVVQHVSEMNGHSIDQDHATSSCEGLGKRLFVSVYGFFLLQLIL